MATIITRVTGPTAKSSPLTNTEIDNNFINLNSELANVDLSGVTAAALLRSTADVITSMFVYDTSKDSDGGAWTERCQNTSWYNEPLSNKWLGACASELIARSTNGTPGTQLAVNGGFDTDVSWTKNTGWSISNGRAVLDGTQTAISYFSQAVLTIGKVYQVLQLLLSSGTRIENTSLQVMVSSRSYLLL